MRSARLILPILFFAVPCLAADAERTVDWRVLSQIRRDFETQKEALGPDMKELKALADTYRHLPPLSQVDVRRNALREIILNGRGSIQNIRERFHDFRRLTRMRRIVSVFAGITGRGEASERGFDVTQISSLEETKGRLRALEGELDELLDAEKAEYEVLVGAVRRRRMLAAGGAVLIFLTLLTGNMIRRSRIKG